MGVLVRVLAFLIICLSGYTQAEDIQKLRMEWLSQKQDSLVAEIRVAKKVELLPMMETLGQLWLRRDGALATEVAPYIAEIIIREPALAFSWFSEHPTEFNEFVTQSQYSIFTDYAIDAEIQIEMEYLRQRLVLASAEFGSSNQGELLIKMAEKLSKKVQAIKVRVVD